MNLLKWNFENEGLTPGITLLLIAVAYAFSIAIRLFWVQWASDIPEYFWNGQLMINTNDGYYFASGVQKYLEGMHADNPRVPDLFYTAAITVTALAVKLLPISIDTAILYMPAVVSSLVVIPLILIGRLYGSTMWGFFAALIGSIAWSYYNRTMVGYYDTDMFSAMAPMFILYFLMGSIKTERLIFALLAALSVLVYPFLYDSGRAVVYGMGVIYMAYMVVFHRKDEFTYFSILLISIGLMKFGWGIQLALILFLYLLIRQKILTVQMAYYGAIAGVVLFFVSGNVFGIIWDKVSGYLIRDAAETGLHFYNVKQTVREAGVIPFETMANRISGSIPGLIAALIGYILLVVRHRTFLLALPLIGIGLFSLWGGLRFTVYAVPVAALSAVYLFYTAGQFIERKGVRIAAIALMTAAMLYPNIAHIQGYKVPTVFTDEEVKSLERLSAMGTDKDFVVTWWDYGYPIWYYGNKNTLIDGAKHHHDNFIVSEILMTDSPLEAARLSRIAIETYVDSDYKTAADTLFKNEQPDQLDPNAYLETLKYGDVKLPAATRDVYLYLPLRMLDIFPTVTLFSNLDLSSGQAYSQPFYYMTSRFKDSAEAINLGRGIIVDKQSGMVRIGQQEIPLRAIYRTNLRQDGSIVSDQQLVRMNGTLTLIFMSNYGKFLLVDDKMLHSTYLQMFVLGNYDESLFEPVDLTPYSRTYRLKI